MDALEKLNAIGMPLAEHISVKIVEAAPEGATVTGETTPASWSPWSRKRIWC
jgi:hypothetical protein